MEATVNRGEVKAPPITPQIAPDVTVGDYLDGQAFYEDVIEVLALHVVRSVMRAGSREKALKPLWWLPARQGANG